MNKIAHSLISLADQADEIARGGLDMQIETPGVDEIGKLGSAFEQMRVSLKDRLDELDHLLKVSQGVASNLTMQGAARHILDATLVNGACSSRLVLRKESSDEDAWEIGEVFSAGACAKDYEALDEVMVDLLREEKITIVLQGENQKHGNSPRRENSCGSCGHRHSRQEARLWHSLDCL